MDVVIPFRHSKNLDRELIYTLRSAEKFIPDLGNVFIVGRLPYWSSRLLYCLSVADLPSIDIYQNRNIALKLTKACYDKRISDDFIVTDDDMILTKTWDFGYYHRGPMFDETGTYSYTNQNTLSLFPGKKINNFNVHAPHVYNKQKFIRSVASIDWSIPYGYSIHTIYAVMNGIEGTYSKSLKYRSRPTKDQLEQDVQKVNHFSFSDNAFKKDLKDFLQSMFPNKSKYES